MRDDTHDSIDIRSMRNATQEVPPGDVAPVEGPTDSQQGLPLDGVQAREPGSDDYRPDPAISPRNPSPSDVGGPGGFGTRDAPGGVHRHPQLHLRPGQRD